VNPRKERSGRFLKCGKISAGTLLEARITATSLNVLSELNELVSEFGIRTVAVDDIHAQIASEGFAKYGKGRHKT